MATAECEEIAVLTILFVGTLAESALVSVFRSFFFVRRKYFRHFIREQVGECLVVLLLEVLDFHAR